MDDALAATLAILERLVAFETISERPNGEFVEFMGASLAAHGVRPLALPAEDGQRFNLFAEVGPAVPGGIVLSGHSDVVPTTGQSWTVPPFRLTRRGNRVHGRGTTDMKGFLACVLAMVPRWQSLGLRRPIGIALSYDEEVGSFGAVPLAAWLAARRPAVAGVLVGEPTSMRVVAGHKGGVELRTRVIGRSCHSAAPAAGLSALAYALRFVQAIEAVGEAQRPWPGSPFEPPTTTLNVGTLMAGTARNVVPGEAVLDWELRLHPGDDPEPILTRIEAVGAALAAEMRSRDARAELATTIIARYPGLAVIERSPAVEFARALTGDAALRVVPFGTDAGCFQAAGLPAAVVGPGDIAQAHQPDEWIELAELAACLEFLERLGARLAV